MRLIRLEWSLVTWALIPMETGESRVLDFADPIDSFLTASFQPVISAGKFSRFKIRWWTFSLKPW
jgi:hypothetical protein